MNCLSRDSLVVLGALVFANAKLSQFVPGSHLWDHARLPKVEEAVPAEMEIGEAFLFLASAVHAGGANTTSESRTVHGFFYCRAYLRPEASIFVPTTLFQILQPYIGVRMRIH